MLRYVRFFLVLSILVWVTFMVACGSDDPTGPSETADLYVNGATGSDDNGDGSSGSPYKTITYAMIKAESGDVVLVAAGTYGPDTGEISPFVIPEGVTLRGEDHDEVILVADVDVFEGMIVESGATVESFTMSNKDPVGREDRAGIGISSTDACLIRDIKVSKAFRHSAIRTRNLIESASAIIEECALVVDSGLYESRGMELVFATNVIVRNCLVSGWRTGIFTNTDSTPLIEHCSITDNTYGVEAYSDIGDDPPFNNIDLGGGARGSEGNNLIQGNSNYGFWNRNSEGPVYARFNTWDNDPPIEGDVAPVDYYAANGGTWIWD